MVVALKLIETKHIETREERARRLILAILEKCWPDGLTTEEIVEKEPILSEDDVRHHGSELCRDGKLDSVAISHSDRAGYVLLDDPIPEAKTLCHNRWSGEGLYLLPFDLRVEWRIARVGV